ncbi:hypothetical protein ACIBG8_09895 [Nonomuraea sp. NPDC050556]|uniref:hypothetical protein n=1 Tax=Nonomuraea sp. NPDC050556 TaxID=3364369 RepID=UPI00379F96FE
MARSGTTHWRNLLVGLHVVTSVGWMALALALTVLLSYGMRTGDTHAYVMANVIDDEALLHLANASVFTGVMLAGMTRWGYARHWWVLVKLVVTLSQLYVGIFLLNPKLQGLATGAEPSTALMVATALMASALAAQTWLSVAKPWKRTPWTTTTAKPEVPGWMLATAIAVPVADYVLATFVFGHPAPIFTVLGILGYPLWRTLHRTTRHPAAVGAS